MTDDQIAAITASVKVREDRGRTHWDGCYTDVRHGDCAIRILLAALAAATQEIERLKAALDCPMILCPYERRAEAVARQRDALREALKSLRNECHAMLAMAYDEMKQAAGYTNVKCLTNRVEEADAALAATEGQ